MKLNDMFLFTRGCLIQIWASKSRMLLTVAGIALATILFLLSSIFIDTYIASLYTEANACSSNGVLVTGNMSKKMVADLEVQYDEYPITKFSSPITSFTTSYSWNNMELSVMPIVVGCSANLFQGPAFSTQGIQSMYESEIIEGQTISNEDVAAKRKVVVISQLAKDVFFGNETALNKTIDLSLTGLEEDKEPFTVIGVYQNSYDEETVLHQLKNASYKSVDSINLQLNCYIPVSVVNYSIESGNSELAAIVIATGTDIAAKKNIQVYYRLLDSVEINYQEAKIKSIDEINAELLKIMHILMIVMMFIAGLNLFNSMMFSIRERISEIGIRKAVGASSFDIVRQFMFEGIVVSAIGAVFAIVLISLGASAFQILINRYSAITLDIVLSWKVLLESLCYVILMGILFSVIPAMFAAKTNIIDAIRFD